MSGAENGSSGRKTMIRLENLSKTFPGQTEPAVAALPCNFGEVFTTDGRVEGLGLTLIEDDKSFFPIYNPALEMRKETYNQYGPQLEKLFNPITKALTTKEMTQLNARVDVDGELPEDVAEDWLSENGFVE